MEHSQGQPEQAPRLFYLYPEVTEAQQYADDFYRAAFYLSPLVRPCDRLLLASRRHDSPYDHRPAWYLDSRVTDLAESVRDRVEVRSPAQANRCFEDFEGQRVICLWDERLRNRDPFLKRYNGSVKLIRADHRRVPTASSQYLKASSQEGLGSTEQRSHSEQRLRALIDKLRDERVLIFGTGPSLGSLDFDALPPGLAIATNSMVINRKLLQRMRPQIIVASDPIFHAGASGYAREFRDLLVDAIRLYEATFVFPMRDIGIYETMLPEDVRHRLIGIPIVDSGSLNADLYSHCRVAATRNVMTLMLLPLAASLAPETLMVGFDGRPPGDNGYFWSHSDAFQLTHHMETIREAHPAFFDIDYDAYYREHSQTVEVYLNEMEADGRTVVSLTDSYIPAIKGRYVSGLSRSGWKPPLKRPEVSIVMPLNAGLRRVKAAVHSVQSQSLGDWELLCLPAGCDGEVVAWVEEEMARDPRMTLLPGGEEGLAPALNRGLEAARGHHVCFLFGRDSMSTNSLARRLETLRAAPGYEVLGGRVELVDGAGRAIGVRRGRPVAARLRHARSSIFHVNALFGLAQVMKRFRFDTSKPHNEAWSYVVQILRFGKGIASCGEEPVAEVWVEDPRQIFGTPAVRYAGIEAILDELLHPPHSPLYPEGPPLPLSPVQISRSKARRLQSLFVGQVFLGDETGIDTIIQLMAGLPRVPFLQPVDPAFFEDRAAQVFGEPVGSAALQRKVVASYDTIFAASRRLKDPTSQRDFAIAFQRYAMQVDRVVAALDRRQPRRGDDERRVRRQAVLLSGKSRLQTLRYEFGTVYRSLREEGLRAARRGMNAQREVRRRLRRWRRERRRARAAV